MNLSTFFSFCATVPTAPVTSYSATYCLGYDGALLVHWFISVSFPHLICFVTIAILIFLEHQFDFKIEIKANFAPCLNGS